MSREISHVLTVLALAIETEGESCPGGTEGNAKEPQRRGGRKGVCWTGRMKLEQSFSSEASLGWIFNRHKMKHRETR